MKKILTICFILISCLCFAQSSEQDKLKAIEAQQQLLKEGKITYDDYLKNVEAIRAEKPVNNNPAQNPSTTPVTEDKQTEKSKAIIEDTNESARKLAEERAKQKQAEEAALKQKQEEEQRINQNAAIADNTKQNSLNRIRPGDELLKFSKQFYTGLGAYAGGQAIFMLGYVIAYAALLSTGGTGVGFVGPLFIVGGGILSIAGAVGMTTSFLHIRNAGKLMNQKQDILSK